MFGCDGNAAMKRTFVYKCPDGHKHMFMERYLWVELLVIGYVYLA